MATVGHSRLGSHVAFGVTVPQDVVRSLELGAIGVVGVQFVVNGATADLDDVGRLVLAAGGVAASVAGLAVVAEGGPRARCAAAFLLGWAGAVTGAGIGAARLVLEGPSAIAFVGVAALAVGVGLLLDGACRLILAVRGWRRLWAVPLALLWAQFGLIPVGGAVFGTHMPYLPVAAAPPPAAQLVAIPTRDGVTLTAWFTPSSNGAAVVLLHGSGGSRADSIDQSAVLTRHGYGVLALDARGGSASTAPGIPWGWHGDADIAAAITFLQGQPGVDPERIGAVGLSMGGEQAISAAATDPRLHAVVAEGASLHTYGDLRYLPDDLSGWIQRGESFVMLQVADLMTSASPPLSLADAAANLGDRHVLLIAGMNGDEQAAATDLERIAPDNVTVWRLPDTPHISALAWHPDEWERRVTSFLDGQLGVGQ